MPEPTFVCPIDGCNEEFRRDSYIKHFRANHKAWIAKEMRKGLNLVALNDCMKGHPRPFYIITEETKDYYICFGTKRVYVEDVEAEKACKDNAEEHRAKFMELFMESMNPATMLDMVATKWSQYDKYAAGPKRDAELGAAYGRIAELEAKVAMLSGRVGEGRIGELETELEESKAAATRASYEANKWRSEFERAKHALDNISRELDTVRQRQIEMSLESAELNMKAMEFTKSERAKLEDYPKLKDKVKKYKKALEKSEKEVQKRMMGMMMMMGGGMGGMGAGAGSGSGSRNSVMSGISSDSDSD
jgi:hypothetical protein